jgi:hypothetical protein
MSAAHHDAQLWRCNAIAVDLTGHSLFNLFSFSLRTI